MKVLLTNKHAFLSFTLAVITLFFSSLAFSYNPGLTYDPSRDDALTVGIDESEQGCVYRESDASLGAWTVDDCDYVGAHYACYNGNEWQVAQALGTVTDPGEPLDGDVSSSTKSINNWDPIEADALCKNSFGPAYFFSVPIDADEDAMLGEAITAITAAKKRTWIYYYSDTENIPLSSNYWLGNRTQYINLLSTDLGNSGDDGGVADCTLMNRDSGMWQDAACSESHSFACYDSGTWLITSEQDEWKAGFATCDENYGLQTLYAVPRDSTENSEIAAAALPSGGTGDSSDYNQVWLNRTDLAFEEFFISNQTRQAWWGEGQPSNSNNSDCALIDSSGNWIAESCNGYVAYHACYLGDSSTGIAQWELTKNVPDLKMAESALGFGYCKQLPSNPDAEYRPPNSAVSNTALAALLSSGEYVWINYSDQVSEGSWKVTSQFEDFVSTTDVLEGDAEDCGYFSLDTDDKRNWLAGQCYAGGASMTQGFACTNGYEWKIATEALSDGSSLESDLWKDGFTACEDAFGEDYEFAAPYDADQNSRLSLALRLSGNTQAWMNLNDAESEGEWVANGPVVNLSPVLSLSTQREFSEKEIINLSVTAIDPETSSNVGLTYSWSIIDQRVGEDDTGTDVVITPSLIEGDTENLSISAIDLLNDNYYLDIQLQVTDADTESPATTTTVITIEVISPLRAAYDFNIYSNPQLDISGNGHDLELDVSDVEIVANDNDVDDYYAKMDENDLFEIDGSVDGLQVGSATDDQYTIVYRFKLDEFYALNNWSNFLMKGTTTDRQPAIFIRNPYEAFYYSTAIGTSTNINLDGKENLRLGQWVTGAFVKTPTEILTYIDKVEEKLDDPTSPEDLTTVPDASLTKSGTARYNNESWKFGNANGDSTLPLGFAGGIDDIRIYDRALTVDELKTLFPDQPRGEFEFADTLQSGDENEVEGAVTEIQIPVSRNSGDDGIVSVGFNLVSDSAILDADFQLKDDPEIIGSADRGKGTLTWQVHDQEDKNITIELIGDSIREGTETFTVELERLGSTEPELGADSITSVNIVDKTPDLYGVISIAASTDTENIAVDEGESGLITIERSGTDSLGAFDVIYQIEAVTATDLDDFSITQSGFPITGTESGSILGQGRLSFPDNDSGTAVMQQLQTISFTTVHPDVAEADEYFTVTLLSVTDPGTYSLSDSSASPILGTMLDYSQVINDITPGRVNFKEASYSADEVDQGGDSNIVLVSLERLAGDDGAMCVTLDATGSTVDTADYEISYLHPSSSGELDIYWADKDTADKSVQITIVNDQIYDADEVLQLSWVRKANCDGVDTAIPDYDVGDNASTTISITDRTTPVSVKFSSTSYSVSERGASVDVTILATQSGDFSDGNRINNNAFSVYLNTSDGSAEEGTDFDDLAGLKVVSFTASSTEQVITIPVNDNCDPVEQKQFTMSVLDEHNDLPVTLPVSLIDVSSANSSVDITDAYPAVVVSAAVSTNGVTDAAITSGGNYIVTGDGTESGGFPSKNLKLDSTNTTDDGCLLSYSWTYVAASPELPTAGVGNAGSDLPSGFSSFTHIAGSSVGATTEVGEFTLPFVVEDTDLSYQLTLSHPEQADEVIDISVPIAANWSRVKNDRGWCTDVDNGYIETSETCTAATARNFIFNPATKQIIGQSLYGGEYGCWQAVNGGGDDVLYRSCSDEARQVITFLGADENDNMQSSDGYDLVDTSNFFTGERGLQSLSGTNSGGQDASRKHWFWTN
jgi:hypothetical protein